MKKSGLGAALAAVALLGVGIAVAVGNLSDNALISRSYYENTYLPALSDTLRQRAEKDTTAVYQKAEADLKARADALSAGASRPYETAAAKAGDTLELEPGGVLLLQSGGGTLNSGALADVTAGAAIGPGEALALAHRYIVTSDAKAAVSMTQAGELYYLGEGTLRSGGVSGPGGNTGKALPFTDVAETDWYHAAVCFVYDKGYFAGTAADQFSSNTSMNRAMVATVLHRVSGGGAAGQGLSFQDVPAGQWYSDGVAWASANGIVNGMGDGLYAPEAAVTREQLVTMLYRYQKDFLGRTAEAETAALDRFPDGSQVSPWAREAVSWAVKAGIVTGRDTGHLDPGGTATRAEVSAILQRFTAA